MEEFNTERKSSELSKEEVSIYTDGCGVTPAVPYSHLLFKLGVFFILYVGN